MPKEYLADGVYADFDGYSLILTTENGVSVSNTIYIDQEVYSRFLGYAARALRGESKVVQNNPCNYTQLE